MRTTSSREVYRNDWIRVREDEIELPDGTPGIYGVVEKRDFALVLPAEDGGFWLVEQYRHPIGRRSWEFPQGTWPAGAGGGPEELARAELAEEIGLHVEPGALEGPVWLRRFVGPFGRLLFDNRETYFVLRDVVHEVDAAGRTELEVLGDEPHRWWSVDEIVASSEEFAPRELALVLPALLEGPWAGAPRIVS